MNIESDTILKLILPADQIPDGSVVTKRSGRSEFTLRHQLRVYPIPAPKGEESRTPMTIEGTFLVNGHGSVNQIEPELDLCWALPAWRLFDLLQELERDPDDDK